MTRRVTCHSAFLRINEVTLESEQGFIEYRNLPHGGGKISTIGIGAGSLHDATARKIKDIICYGMDHGINLMDTIMYDETAKGAIEPESIARTISSAIEQASDVAINEMIIRPTHQER